MPRAGIFASALVPTSGGGEVVQTYFEGGGNPLTYSQTHPIGIASPDRKVVLGLTAQSTSAGFSVAPKMNGVAMTQIGSIGSRNQVHAYMADVPSGSTALVEFTPTSWGNHGLFLWALYGITGLIDSDTGAGTSSTDPSVTLDTAADDLLIALSCGFSNTVDASWSGVDLDAPAAASTGSSNRYSSASGVAVGASTPITVDWANPNGTTLWAGAFR